MLAQLQREQMVRDVVGGACRNAASAWCACCFSKRRLVPTRTSPKNSGIATGSIGFIRGRCLIRLKKQLEKMGFQ